MQYDLTTFDPKALPYKLNHTMSVAQQKEKRTEFLF